GVFLKLRLEPVRRTEFANVRDVDEAGVHELAVAVERQATRGDLFEGPEPPFTTQQRTILLDDGRVEEALREDRLDQVLHLLGGKLPPDSPGGNVDVFEVDDWH